MSMKNTGTFVQYPRTYTIQHSTANTNYTTPTTPSILWQAGPDGSQIWGISVTPTATVTTANQIQLFLSPDGGTTFDLLPISAFQPTYTMAQTTALPTQLLLFPGGVALSPTNPLPLGGVSTMNNLSYANSTLSELATYFYGGQTSGTANAQLCPYAFNSSGTLATGTPTTGSIVDFEATLTNTAAMTLKVGTQTGTPALVRASGTNVSAGDITKRFRYRATWDGTQWVLMLTPRIYVGQGQAQANVFSAWGGDC